MNTRRKLTKEEKEAAAYLKHTFESKKQELNINSQEKLGEIADIGSQGVIGQYLNGYIAMSLKNFIKICGALNEKPEEAFPSYRKHYGIRASEDLPDTNFEWQTPDKKVTDLLPDDMLIMGVFTAIEWAYGKNQQKFWTLDVYKKQDIFNRLYLTSLQIASVCKPNSWQEFKAELEKINWRLEIDSLLKSSA